MLLIGAVSLSGAVAVAAGVEVASPAFSQGKPIPAVHSCDGKELSPPLTVHGVPAGAKSLALIVDDPDAPAGVWTHWVLWNIPAATREIPQGKAPAGAVQGNNSWGRPGYGGPCPPSGTHHYHFRLYALKERLELPAGAERAELERAMRGKVLSSGELMGTYRRK